ncbi:MAG: hypothetical protein OEZ58_03505 [Gammaproteobacteria bacterium]|nr:hypothetical protein [Gammaproteobacteria bacterium]
MMFKRIALIVFFHPLLGWADEAFSEQNKVGYYQVQQAYLNTNHCNVTGNAVSYASKFLRISPSNKKPTQLVVSTCDGDDLDFLNCGGGRRSTHLNQETKNSIEGYYFRATSSVSKKGTPQCLFTALRRRVRFGKAETLQYERTDWSILISDYKYECTRENAQIFYESQSLDCSTHIVIDAIKVKELEQ